MRSSNFCILIHSANGILDVTSHWGSQERLDNSESNISEEAQMIFSNAVSEHLNRYGCIRQGFASELGPRPFQRLQLAVAARLLRDGSEDGSAEIPGQRITFLAIFIPALMTLAWVGSVRRLLLLGGGTQCAENGKHRRKERHNGNSKGRLLFTKQFNGLLEKQQFAQAAAQSAQVNQDDIKMRVFFA